MSVIAPQSLSLSIAWIGACQNETHKITQIWLSSGPKFKIICDIDAKRTPSLQELVFNFPRKVKNSSGHIIDRARTLEVPFKEINQLVLTANVVPINSDSEEIPTLQIHFPNLIQLNAKKCFVVCYLKDSKSLILAAKFYARKTNPQKIPLSIPLLSLECSKSVPTAASKLLLGYHIYEIGDFLHRYEKAPSLEKCVRDCIEIMKIVYQRRKQFYQIKQDIKNKADELLQRLTSPEVINESFLNFCFDCCLLGLHYKKNDIVLQSFLQLPDGREKNLIQPMVKEFLSKLDGIFLACALSIPHELAEDGKEPH